jgi:hypothetical protein
MPPLKTNYSKRRLPPEQLKEQMKSLIEKLSPDVAEQAHKLVRAYQSVSTLQARDAHYLILHEWGKHGDESKLSHFMTDKTAQITKRLEEEQRDQPRDGKKEWNLEHGREYRKLATDYLQSNFSPEALAQILKCEESLRALGSTLHKKWDAEIVAKCPNLFESVQKVRRWRQRNWYHSCIKSLVLRVLPCDLRQTLASHSASQSARLESLVCAASLAMEDLASAASRTGGKLPKFPHFEDHPYFWQFGHRVPPDLAAASARADWQQPPPALIVILAVLGSLAATMLPLSTAPKQLTARVMG